jgi:ABC-type phosphate/phosphonate transport system substrate-binding protein
MYGFDELKPHWEALYETAARHVSGAPRALSWNHDVYETWTDPHLALGQTCGWPLVTRLDDIVRVVGSFDHVAGESERATYRSVLVAQELRPLDSFVGHRVAVNGFNSLSGWISLRAAVGMDAAWSEIVETGSHRLSLQAVAAGHADVASIDAVTWWYAQRLWPNETRPLQVVGRGPRVPCLPLIVPAMTTDQVVTRWREGFSNAVDRNGAACAALGISGFVSLEFSDYQRLLAPLQVFA